MSDLNFSPVKGPLMNAFTSDGTHTKSRSERRDAAKNRCKILDVARTLFRESGIHAISMHQIAQTAGIGQGTLYRRYANKGELCLDLLQDSVDEFLTQLDELIERNITDITDDTPSASSLQATRMSAIDLLEELIKRIVSCTEDKVHLLTVIYHEHCESPHMTPFHQPIFVRVHEMLTRVLNWAMERGDVVPLNTAHAADLLLSAINPQLYLFQREARGFSKEEIIDGIRRIYLNGLRA